MKILFCSPYLQKESIHRGGINIWADNILQYYHTLENHDIEITPVSFDRKYYISVDTRFVRRAYLGVKELSSAVKEAELHLKKKRFDVVHICTSASLSLIKDLKLMKLAKKYGAKSVVHLHFGRTPELLNKKNWEWKLLKKVVEGADSVITMDMQTYRTLASLSYKHIYYCPNPLSQAIMSQIAEETDKVTRLQNKLLFVGHVLPSKGVYELVDAAKRIPNIELHVIGKAEEPVLSEIKRIAEKSNDREWLKMRGEIPHDEVIRELMSATLFVFPSYTEGFPNVILEAMACGCPIASSDVGAIPEMLDIDNDACGICYKPKSSDEVYEAIVSMLDDKMLRDQYASKAEERVYNKYAVNIVFESLLAIWKGKRLR